MSLVTRGLMAVSAGLALGLVAAPALADVLVVRSQGASARTYPPGRSLPESATLTLAANDAVTVLGAGGTRTFRGPGSFRVSAPSQLSPLAQAMANQGRRQRVGAVRGDNGGTLRANVWQVDVTQSGTVCVAAGLPVSLWRPDASAAASLRIEPAPATGSDSAWPAGIASVAWPAAVPVTSGAEYRLRLQADQAPVTVRVITVPTAPSDSLELARLLIHHGCALQLDRLLAGMPAE